MPFCLLITIIMIGFVPMFFCGMYGFAEEKVGFKVAFFIIMSVMIAGLLWLAVAGIFCDRPIDSITYHKLETAVDNTGCSIQYVVVKGKLINVTDIMKQILPEQTIVKATHISFYAGGLDWDPGDHQSSTYLLILPDDDNYKEASKALNKEK